MASTTSRTAPGFWRCVGCNTPNPTADYLTRCLGCGRPIPPFPTPEPTASPASKPAAVETRRGRLTLISGLVYAGVVLAAIGMIRLGLDWGLVTALVFLPGGLFLVPILPMAVGAVRARRSVVFAVVLADALLVLGPLMGFNVPASRWFSTAPSGSKVRVMTFTHGKLNVDIPMLFRYLDRHRIDVVCFQNRGPKTALEDAMIEAGWHFDRERRAASRFPIVKEYPASTTFDRIRLKHPDGFEFLVGSVHLPDPRGVNRPGLGLKLARWDEEVVRLRELMADAGATPLIVAGDFNMPGSYHGMVSLRASYPSSHEQAGWGYGYTSPSGLPWVRLDDVVAGRDWSFTRSWVGPELGSEHRPVIAEAVLLERKSAD